MIEQQRVRLHVVGPQRLVVERTGGLFGHGEGATVEHDVAVDGAYAHLLHPA